MPKDIDVCASSRYSPLLILQKIALFLLRRSQYWDLSLRREFTNRRISDVSGHNDLTSFQIHTPILNRKELREKFHAALHTARLDGHDALMTSVTSGSSGIPMQVVMDKKTAARYRIMRRRLFAFAEITENDEFISPRTRESCHFCPRNLFIRADIESILNSTEELLKIIQQRNIACLYGYTTLLSMLAAKIIERKLVVPHLKALINVGENLSPRVRRALEKNFRAKVFDFYASVELGAIAQECQRQHGLHINDEFYLIEILSSEGKPLPDHEWGRIVITQYDVGVVPIIRYETGDVGMIDSTPCPCGKTMPRLKLRGRDSEFLVLKNKSISPHAFRDILERCDPHFEKFERYQVIFEDDRKLILLLVPTALTTARDLEKVEKICREFLGEEVTFEIQLSETVERFGVKTPVLIRRAS